MATTTATRNSVNVAGISHAREALMQLLWKGRGRGGGGTFRPIRTVRPGLVAAV